MTVQRDSHPGAQRGSFSRFACEKHHSEHEGRTVLAAERSFRGSEVGTGYERSLI
jgi:hypothetical protein